MKKILQFISFKTLLLTILAILCIFLTGVLGFVQTHMKRSLVDQEMAKRWSAKKDASQISAFYGERAVEDSSYFRGVGVSLDQALVNASITLESENEDARLWMDALSRKGTVNLVSELGKAEINAIGIKGEFFQFHPLRLVSGSYISENSLMKDGIMIDEETAWQLFGSNDVAGMQVELAGVPHIIIGVYERPQGRIEKAAGLEKPMCFLGIESLEKYGKAVGGYCYEIVLPNPIKGFALSTMNTVLAAETTEVKMIENTTRYQLLSLGKVIQSFGTRSMSLESIQYPYWENIARGYEDIFALFLLLKIVLLLYPGLLLVILVIGLYRKKTWTIESLWKKAMDIHYEMGTGKKEKSDEKNGTDTSIVRFVNGINGLWRKRKK